MSNLRNNVIKQLTNNNKVLDTSTSMNNNPVLSYYQNLNQVKHSQEDVHNNNEESYFADSRTQENHIESEFLQPQGATNEQTISPFSCASELLRITPISGLEDLAGSRGQSPMVYADISACTVRTTAPKKPAKKNAVNNINDVICDPPVNNNDSIIIREADNTADSNINIIIEKSLPEQNDSLPGDETFQVFITPENSSTPKQKNTIEDDFEKNIEELIEQLSSERSAQNSTKESEKSKRKKLKKDPAMRIEIEKDKYPMLASCEDCVKKCNSKFSEEDREKIWTEFRNLNKQSQRNFISRNVLKETKKVTTVKQSRRHNTYKWILNKIQVCKQFFLSTLGFKCDQTVITILKANHKLGVINPEIEDAAPEQRGKSQPWNKLPESYRQDVKQFIEKQQPTVSHYNIKHAPKRKYLPCGVTFSDLYKSYTNYCIENGIKICSWTFFHSVIKEMNLSTANPTQDLCTTCANHDKEHPKSENNSHSCDTCECGPCKKFENHDKNRRLSRQLLDKDLENLTPEIKLVTADMQKVILMPKLTVKDEFFSRKVVLLNETFASPGKNKPSYCIVWHEGEAGKKAHNVASAYVEFMTIYCKDEKHIIIYADNCCAQNKNRVFYSALLRLVNSPAIISAETIRIVYLEPGHTYMAADTVHANISKKFARFKNIYDKDDFIDKMKKSRKNLEVREISHKEMIIFKDDLKRLFPKNYNIQSLKIVEFRRGSTSLFLKKSYDEEEFKDFNALKPEIVTLYAENKDDLIKDIQRETKPRGITSVKKQDLLKLCLSMPQARRKFFEDLNINDHVKDLDDSALQ